MLIRMMLRQYQVSKFLYPFKLRVLYFLVDGYLDIEKSVPDETEERVWDFLELISVDVETFIESTQKGEQPRFKAMKKINLNTLVYKTDTLSGHLRRLVFRGALPAYHHILQLRLRKFKEHEAILKHILIQCQHLYDMTRKQKEGNLLLRIFKVVDRAAGLKRIAERDLQINFDLIIQSQKKQEQFQSKVNRSQAKLMSSKYSIAPETSKAMKLQGMVQTLMSDPEFQHDVEKEFEQLVVSVIDIRNKSYEGFEGKCTLETKEILTALISLTDLNEYKLNRRLYSLALKILRKVIEMENQEMTTPAADWETDDWLRYKEQIEERQELLAELDVVGLVCRIISQREHIEDDIF